MKSFRKNHLFLLPFLLIAACRDANDQLQQEATIQGREAAEAASRLENERASEMERDFTARMQVYQGVSGVYQGRFVDDAALPMEFTITLVPTVWPRRGARVRTQTEIANDLIKLELIAEIQVRTAAEVVSACVFNGVHPDPQSGRLHLLSTTCPYTVALWMDGQGAEEASAGTAGALYEGRLRSVGQIYLRAYSKQNGKKFELGLNRVRSVRARSGSR